MQNTTTCLSPATHTSKAIRAQLSIRLPMYECKLVVIVSESVSKEANKLYKKHKIVDDFGDEAEGAVVFFGTDVYYMIIGSDYLTHNTLAHEIFHATVRITEDRDITDEETQAWLAGHLTDMVYKFLDKKKLQVEHG